MGKRKLPKTEKKKKKIKTPILPPIKRRTKTEVQDVLVMGNQYKYKNPVEAWDDLMVKFILKDPLLFDDGNGAELTNALYTNDLTMYIEDPSFDKGFDFGYLFNYRQTKWTSLLNNYIDLDKLDQIKEKIRGLEADITKNRNYNIGLHFADTHSNGKGCLLSGILSRQYYIKKPVLTVLLRSSEIVTRLPFDLLFFTRLGEYIYGHEEFTLKIIIKQAYADDSVLIMYDNRKSIEDIYKDCEDKERELRVMTKLNTLKVIDEEDYTTYPTYQAHLRSFKVLRPDLYPDRKSLTAGECVIGNWDGIPLPDICPSIIDRNNIKSKYLKFVNKYGLNMENIKTKKTKKRKVIRIK